MTHVDLAIIGSGSGNTIATKEFDDWQIAIIEESTFGGTCSNVGCIPTKMLVLPAERVAEAREAEHIGVHAHIDSVDWPGIRDRVFTRVDAMSVSGRTWRHSGRPNTQLIESHVEFVDAHTLRTAGGDTLTAEHIVIATGSRPVIPGVIEASGVPFHTSNTVMRVDAIPKRLIILGGGYISAEFAHVFSAYGANVTVIARSGALLRHVDQDISERFTALAKDAWDVRLNVDVVSAEETNGEIRIGLSDGSTVTGDLLLVATGRIPNSDHLNVEAAGVLTHPDGRIVADTFQRTTAENVWTLGDCSSPYQLKHVANHEARVVAHNLMNPDSMIETDHRFVPSAVFTHPQLAAVGMTEAEAKAAGRNYTTALQEYGSTAYGWALEDTTSVCKVIADADTGQLLGAHVMGEQAAALLQPVIQAMSFGLGAREMARGQYWVHPAITEVVENALLHLDVPRLTWEFPPRVAAVHPDGSMHGRNLPS